MLEPLVVDLDGVLRIWDPAITAEAEAAYGLPAGHLARSAFGDRDRLERAITGTITDEEWREEIARELEASHGSAGRLAVRQWSTPVGRTDERVLAILRRERRRRRIALFSNATSRLDADLEALGLLKEVDVVFNSSSLGLAKPSVEAFEAVADALGAAPADCLFVDDTRDNVLGAKLAGFQVHHYLDADGLDRFLTSRTTRTVESTIPTAMPTLKLVPLSAADAPPLRDLVASNREHLTQNGDYLDLVALDEAGIAAMLGRDGIRGYTYGVVLSDAIVGIVSLVPVDPPKFGCGYWLAESATGQGIATEAMRSLIQHAQKSHGATDIFAGVTSGHTPSTALLSPMGFTVSQHFESYTRYHLKLDRTRSQLSRRPYSAE